MSGIPRALDKNVYQTSTSALNVNLNAGAKSLFMLSGIRDQHYHKNLQEHYGIKLPAPDSLNKHWQIFADITQKSKSPWRCEVLYFPRKWIDRLKSQEWIILADYLMQMHRSYYNVWQNIYKARCKQNTVILEPAKFNIRTSEPVYYSLNFSAITQNILESAKKKSQISWLDEVWRVSQIYMNSILTNYQNTKPLYDVVNETIFYYYHSNPQDYKNILDSGIIPATDQRFIHNKNGQFPKNSQFFKGCIKISRKE